MAKILCKFWILFLSIGIVSQQFCFAADPTPPPALNKNLPAMLEKIVPAVVNIRAQIRVNDLGILGRLPIVGPIPESFLSIGSGVVVDASKGYLLTNAHVVKDAELIIVTLKDGHHYTAKIIGLDQPSDVAVLQIKAKDLTAIPIGDSNDLKVGDAVAAIGNPFGLNQTVTSGIVSGLGRTALGIENYENFIQTDAPINPGNSGGALVNMQGQLIGLNTAILAPDRGSIGVGFAIPSNMFKTIMLQLIAYGNVRRGTLGVGAQDITPDLVTAFKIPIKEGAAITQIIPNSPAEKAGLQVGDVITSVNNMKIKNANDVVNAVGLIRVDSNANIEVLRDNKKVVISALLIDPQKRKDAGQAADPFFYGVGLKEFTLLSPMHGDVKGILVVSVEEDSNAWRSDLRPGDVITSANQQKVTSIADLKKVAANNKGNLLLNVLRGEGAVFVVISTDS